MVHPLHLPGLPDALRAVDGVSVVTPADGDGVVDALRDGADVLVTFVWDERFLAPGLRWVQATSAGVEQFPATNMRAGDVVLTTARGTNAGAVALHAVALLLALVRGVGSSARDGATGVWNRESKTAVEVDGWTLGVLGLGAAGEQVARLGRALGMRVIGTKAHPQGYNDAADEVYGPDGAVAVCERADAVVITLPGGPVTDGLVGQDALVALGDGFLVNVGRGSVVDEGALVAALKACQLRGAGLDVTREEPLPRSSPLWDLSNVVVTPHIAGMSDRVVRHLAERFRENLDAYRGQAGWVERVV